MIAVHVRRAVLRSGPMGRRSVRFSAHVATVVFVSGAAAYGCGGSSTTADDGPDGGIPGADGSQDGTFGTVDGTDQDTPDGQPLADDARASDAEGGTLADGANDADASSDGALQDADADAGPPPPPPGPLSASYVDFDINHVLETGQSNAVANGAHPEFTLPINTVPYTTAQPYTNLMFDTGVMTATDCNGDGCPAAKYVTPTSFVPLVERDDFFLGSKVETASSGLANEVSNLALTTFMFNVKAGYPKKHDVLVSLHGRSGNTYWCLRKGGCNYKPADECLLESH